MTQTANIGVLKTETSEYISRLSIPSASNWYLPVFWDHNSRIPAMSKRHWIREV